MTVLATTARLSSDETALSVCGRTGKQRKLTSLPSVVVYAFVIITLRDFKLFSPPDNISNACNNASLLFKEKNTVKTSGKSSESSGCVYGTVSREAL